MSVLESILLGIIQGLTEFLPVSSSGHIEIGKSLLNSSFFEEENLLFTVILHFATAISTIVVFRKTIVSLLKGLFKKEKKEMAFSFKIVVSMIPAALVGFFFEDEIASLFSGSLSFVGYMLIITALLLYLADKAKSTARNVGFIDSLLIGIAQAIAILPGISRSGSTIAISVLLGIDKKKSAEFSFLMVIPLILGKIAKDILSGELEALSTTNFLPFLFGFLAALISGYFACNWMLELVRRSKLSYFAIYCLIVGIIAINS
jgi:undecaprenyl-diphosphatase